MKPRMTSVARIRVGHLAPSSSLLSSPLSIFGTRAISRPQFRDLPFRIHHLSVHHTSGQPLLFFSRFLSSHASLSSVPDFVPLNLEAELERFEQEVKHGESSARPRISSPTRMAGMLVAAGNAGRVDILHRSLELLDQSADANNRGLLLALLTQFVRFNDIKALQLLVERLSTIDQQSEADVIRTQRSHRPDQRHRPATGGKEGPDAVEDVLSTVHEEEEATMVLVRPYPYYGAFRALLAEHARLKDPAAFVRTLDLASRSAIGLNASMRAMVKGLMEDVGIRPFLKLASSDEGAARQHPETLNVLVRCMTAMVGEGTLKREMLGDALRLAAQFSKAIKEFPGQGIDTFSCYRCLLHFYRVVGAKPEVTALLTQFDQHKVSVTYAMMKSALPGLRLEQLDRVLSTLRVKKNPDKPSRSIYMKIAQGVNYQETVSDFLRYFVGNYKTDYPGEEIKAHMINRALLGHCQFLHVPSATAMFNLMQPATSRLPCSEPLPEPICQANDDTYVIYIKMLAKVLEMSRDDRVHYIKRPIPSQEEVVALAKQTYELALRNIMVPPRDVYTSMLSIYVAARQIGQADVVFTQMQEAGHEPRAEHYQSLIEGFSAVGNETAARNLQRQMQRRNLVTDDAVGAQPTAQGRQANGRTATTIK